MKRVTYIINLLAIILLASSCNKESEKPEILTAQFDKYEILNVSGVVVQEVRLSRTANLEYNPANDYVRFDKVDLRDIYTPFNELIWINARDIKQDEMYSERRFALTFPDVEKSFCRIRLILK